MLAYHIIPGEALTLEQLQAMDGQLLQSMLEGDAGMLKVSPADRGGLLVCSAGRRTLGSPGVRAGPLLVVVQALIASRAHHLSTACCSPFASPLFPRHAASPRIVQCCKPASCQPAAFMRPIPTKPTAVLTSAPQVRNTGLKAALQTTSGQTVAIYQYNLKAGSAIVHTIKGVSWAARAGWA